MKKAILILLCVLIIAFHAHSQVSVIGTATPAGNWTYSYTMNGDPNNENGWITNLYLSVGQIKFIESPAADTIGGDNFPQGTGVVDGPAINVPESGFYRITYDTATMGYAFYLGRVGINTETPWTTLDVAGGISSRSVFGNVNNDSINVPENINLFILTGGLGTYDTMDVILPTNSFVDGLRLIILNFSDQVARINVEYHYVYIPVGYNAEFLLTYYVGWRHLSSSQNAVENGSWQTSGNAGLNGYNQFLGTRDSTRLSLRTNDLERMNISAAGNVGIGTDDPDNYTFKLDVTGSNGNVLRLNSMNNSEVGDKTSLVFYSDNILRSEITSVMSTPSLSRLAFFTGVSIPYLNIFPEERLSIGSGGQVGIGNTAPTQKLEVNGKIKLDDDNADPEPGTMRWNDMKNDFEGYNGTEWLSLTKSSSDGWGGIDEIEENEADTMPQPDHFRRMGYAVAMYGNFAVVGENLNTTFYNGPSQEGKAYVFEYNSIDKCWNFLDTLKASDGHVNDGFGETVAINNSYIIIGAPSYDDFPDDQAGKVYFFKRYGSAFVEEGAVTGENQDDYFGTSLDVNGAGHLIIGAPYANSNEGKVYFYFIWGTGFNPYAELLTTVDNPVPGNSIFGRFVEMSDGYYAYISAPSEDKLYTYHYEDPGSGYNFYNVGFIPSASGRMYTDDHPNNEPGWLIVGRPTETVSGNTNQGKAKIYQRNGASWTLHAELVGSDSEAEDKFGSAVAIYDKYCMVGAPEANVLESANQGKSYIYYKSGNAWSEKSILLASDGDNEVQFGTAVDLNSTYALVGAPNKQVGSNQQQGGVYFFKK